mgnify:FL=1
MSKTLEFKIFCIEAYKREKNLNGYQIMDLFEKYGVLDYLDVGYDILHTTSREYIIEDIDMFISKRKNKEA